MQPKQALMVVVFAAFAPAGATQTMDAPRPPCAEAPARPAYPDADRPPNVATWTDPAWSPPACLGWTPAPLKLVVALAGTFRHAAGAQALLERFGAVSSLRGLRYWSVTDNAWRELITDAAAVTGADSRLRRVDFPAEELKPGATLFFEQTEGRSSGPVVYRLRVLAATSDRIVINTENVTPVRAYLMTVFPPGSLRATYFLERHVEGTWRFYGISATTTEASALAAVSSASYVNRATALYRHFAGVGP